MRMPILRLPARAVQPRVTSELDWCCRRYRYLRTLGAELMS